MPPSHFGIRHAIALAERLLTVELRVTTLADGEEKLGESTNDFDFEVVYQATFTWTGDPPPLDEFVAKGAPAILWPFLREAVADMTGKAGLGAIYLPLMNFSATSAAQAGAATP